MGNYITTTSIYSYKIYGLTNTVIDNTTTSNLIDEAEAVVDGYIVENYGSSMPFTTTPPLLQKITRDISAYYILDYLYSQNNQNVDEWVVNKRDDAFSLLEQIRDDEIKLLLSNTALTVNLPYSTNMNERNLIINMDSEYNWATPDNLLDDIDSARSLSG